MTRGREAVQDRDIEGREEMNLLGVIDQETTLEAPEDLDLDLRDVMLDLDPGMLLWDPPR